MKSILQSLLVLATVITLSNCTTYVDPPSVMVSPSPSTATTTTTQSTATPYDSVTTKRTTTTY